MLKPLPPEDHKLMLAALQRLCQEYLDVEIGQLKAQLLYDELVKLIGHAAYNQGLADAQTYLQTRLADMEVDLHQEVKYEPK